MRHLYDTTKSKIVWSGDGEYLVDGKPGTIGADVVMLEEAADPRPGTEPGITVDPVTVIDVQSGTYRKTWSEPRPMTDAEAQQTLEQLTLVERLTDAELVALENVCVAGHPARATGLRIRAAMLAAVETYSRTARTRTLIGAAIQLGIVSGVERARAILGDDGFTLE